jgi:pimeloyl-ACP methyl ester carboxylesterase
MPKKLKHKNPAPGKMVNVNGREMHVFAKGDGAYTYIFLSGSGTRYPTTDFEPLLSLLVEDSRIAVVEKAGYGWSDVSDNTPRDINTLLQETREALKQAEIPPPYVLVPHSYSGLEALFWAQTYPDEIKAICGLDPAFPEYYNTQKLRLWLVRLFAKLGLITKDMANEGEYAKANAKTVSESPFPANTPAYMFISDGKFATIANVKNWVELSTKHANKFVNGKHIQFDCGHYVHTCKAEEIAAEIKKFMATYSTTSN